MEIRYEAKHTTLETHPIVGKIMALGKPDLIEKVYGYSDTIKNVLHNSASMLISGSEKFRITENSDFGGYFSTIWSRIFTLVERYKGIGDYWEHKAFDGSIINNASRKEIDDGIPNTIHFGAFEICDTNNSDTDIGDLYRHLLFYINTGLFLPVTEPVSFEMATDIYEKYNDTVALGDIGVIADVMCIDNHLIAIVMWDPAAGYENEKEFMSFMGYLRMTRVNPVPTLWKETETYDMAMVSGMPTFEYHPYSTVIDQVRHTIDMLDRFNDAVVCGALKLDFVDHLLSKLNEAASLNREVAQAIIPNIVREDDDDEGEHEVPTEDVSSDILDKALKLYDVHKNDNVSIKTDVPTILD